MHLLVNEQCNTENLYNNRRKSVHRMYPLRKSAAHEQLYLENNEQILSFISHQSLLPGK